MSYDVYLNDPVTKEHIILSEPHFMHGGTYQLGGSTVLWLNITYNYGKILRDVIDNEQGIRWLYGKGALETLPKLEEAILKLKAEVSADYWEPTEGNVKCALLQLKTFARMRPDGIWDGD